MPRQSHKPSSRRSTDFGIPADDLNERTRASRATKARDPGAVPEHSGASGDRTAGVGGNASGPGSSSGGDLDPEIIGVGTNGSGISQSGPDELPRHAQARPSNEPQPAEPIKKHGDKFENSSRKTKR